MVAMSTAATPGTQLRTWIDRRARLLALESLCGEDVEELEQLTAQLATVMSGDELRVRRIRLSEPAEVIDRLVASEPVHPFAGPDDVADRLAEDRRCFVLEHPAAPSRPFNVVWCALWTGICADLAEILDPGVPTGDPNSADTAVFYSIWNVEPGLVGLPGGARLITSAVDALRDELPGLETFVTLSPIPGFRRWLDEQEPQTPADDPAALLAAAARYLTAIRDDGRPVDPVARFHLGNGARLVAVNPDADLSRRGQARSYGLMANYRYEPEDRAANRRGLTAGKVAVGEQVAELLL